MSLAVTISAAAEALLREKAAAHGQPLDQYASAVLEHAATAVTADEALAPFRRQVAESGMSDEQLDAFFEDVGEKVFHDRQH
ncbi:MAG TPA: hypothetical protein VFC78_25035 [Tepidisphaeraceae bacterium]|nr:hypothetical protein [Tepidisphaeraceae bacterium]